MRTTELQRRTLQLGTEAQYRDGRYYDQLYRRRTHDVRFYVQEARKNGGPVLELGAGSGRVTCAIAAAGCEIVGVDSMEPMLEQARRRLARLPRTAQARVRLVRGDLRRLRLRRRFPLVIAPFNVFQHLYTRNDIERAFATCHRHLTPRGRLIFDVMLPDPRALAQSPARFYRCRPVHVPDAGKRYHYLEASHYDPATQIRTINALLEDPDDPAQQRTIPLAHRQFFPAELEALLHYNRFDLEDLRGDFQGGVLGAGSESQNVIARPRRK